MRCESCGGPVGGERGIAARREADGSYLTLCLNCLHRGGTAVPSASRERGRPGADTSRVARSSDVARHESAHAVVAVACGLRVDSVFIDGPGSGGVRLMPGEGDRDPLSAAVVGAAPLALGLTTSNSDRDNLGPFHDGMAEAEAREILREHREAFEEIAQTLSERRELSGREVELIVAGCRRYA